MGSESTSISIYSNNKRVVLSPDSEGKFLVPNRKSNSRSKPLVKVTAMELVNHPDIKKMDPVLSLSDGTKLRVYQGGDPSAMLVMAASLLEKHDNKHKKKIPVISKKKKSFTILDLPMNHGGYSADDYDYPWNDPSLYDDSD